MRSQYISTQIADVNVRTTLELECYPTRHRLPEGSPGNRSLFRHRIYFCRVRANPRVQSANASHTYQHTQKTGARLFIVQMSTANTLR